MTTGYDGLMYQVTISQLKNRLSAYLDRVRAGETILLFDRDRPIARIEPLTGGELPAATLAALERSGAVTRPQHPTDTDAVRARILGRAGPAGALDALVADRLEGR